LVGVADDPTDGPVVGGGQSHLVGDPRAQFPDAVVRVRPRFAVGVDLVYHPFEGVDPVEHLVHQLRRHLQGAPANGVEEVLDGVGQVTRVVEAHRPGVAFQGVSHAEHPVHCLAVGGAPFEFQQGVVQLGYRFLAFLYELFEVFGAHMWTRSFSVSRSNTASQMA
jgi:hypothetical protein